MCARVCLSPYLALARSLSPSALEQAKAVAIFPLLFRCFHAYIHEHIRAYALTCLHLHVYKVAAMLTQLDENNREIEGQRYEIKRLREQVQMLLQRAPVDAAGLGSAGTGVTAAGGEEDDYRSATAPLHRPGVSTPGPASGVGGGAGLRERSRSSMGVKTAGP